MNWRAEHGQPGWVRALETLVALLAFAVTVAAAALFYLSPLASDAAALPPWLKNHAVAVWFVNNGTPLVALTAAAAGLLAMLSVRAVLAGASAAPVDPTPDQATIEALRRQIAPLATGDLGVRLATGDGPLGDVRRTLDALIGGVRVLAITADEAAEALLSLAQDMRVDAASAKALGEEGDRLAASLQADLRHLAAAARLLAERVRAAEAPRPAEDIGAAPTRLWLRAQLGAVVDMVADLAEHAHVVAVEIGMRAMAPTADPALRGIGDEVQRLAESAAAALGRIEPLVHAVSEGARELLPDDRLRKAPETAGLAVAADAVAERLAALPETAGRLRGAGAGYADVQRQVSEAQGALTEVAERLRRATGRFRLPG